MQARCVPRSCGPSATRQCPTFRVSLVGARKPRPQILAASAFISPQFLNPKWESIENEQQFLEALQGEVAAGRCPKQLELLWQDFYNNYRTAVLGSNVPGMDERAVAQIQSSIADTVLRQFINPYHFPSFHTRLMEPYNYFDFGQRYVGSLIDFNQSVLGNPERWAEINALLEQKHNVVLLANHQTEADPGVFAHLLAGFPRLAHEVIYVAGDRVVTDPMCKPFSMGRNLFCVHSRKHLDDDPATKKDKMETNRRTLVAMQRRLNEGGALIWIAPSGGRDRPQDGVWKPATFDPTSVELMRSLVARAKVPGHLYPMAMYSWPMMPPPPTLEKALGERRLTNFTPVGVSLCEGLPVQANHHVTDLPPAEREEQQIKLAQTAHAACAAEYERLERAIKDPAFRAANSNLYTVSFQIVPALV